MPDFYLKTGDLTKPLEATLTNDDGTAIDLTGATVTFRMIDYGPGATVKVSAAAAVVSAIAGTVRYDWQAGDTDTDGLFLGQWLVVFSGNVPLTVPNVGHFLILISESIPAPVVVP